MAKMTAIPQLPVLKCDQLISLFCHNDSSYRNYDLANVSQDNQLTSADIRLSHKMGARFSNKLIQQLLNKGTAISKQLSQIPSSISIFDSNGKIPWNSLEQLFQVCNMYGMREANITKILHKKRPDLIPILDSVVVQKYLEPLCVANGNSTLNLPIEKKMILHLQQFKRVADAKKLILKKLSAKYKLSEVRILDIILWTYFSQPVWFKSNHPKIKIGGRIQKHNRASMLSGSSRSAATSNKLQNLKLRLSHQISDYQERKIFMLANFHDWTVYIAAHDLELHGVTTFTTEDIKVTLKKLIPPYLYNKPGSKMSNVLPADNAWNSPKSSENVKYPCLDVISKSNKSYDFKFIGFKNAIGKKFGNKHIQNLLSNLNKRGLVNRCVNVRHRQVLPPI